MLGPRKGLYVQRELVTSASGNMSRTFTLQVNVSNIGGLPIGEA